MKAFKPGVRMSIFALLLLPILLALGNWQVQRGAFKRELETAYLEQLTRLPVDGAELLASAGSDLALRPFTRVRLSGRYGQEMFFLDNQVNAGEVGYWLFQTFITQDGLQWLVNRGFVAAPNDRSALPDVETPLNEVLLVASIWPDLGLPPLFGEEVWSENWPKRIQRKDLQRMSEAVQSLAWELRLEPGQPGVLQAAPFAEPLSDAKHRGYALTWFGLATALVCGFVIFGFRQGSVDAVSTDQT